MLSGLVDFADDDDESGCPSIYLDRDPAVFASVLALMRQHTVFGGRLPKDDPTLCAAIIAEADYLGLNRLR